MIIFIISLILVGVSAMAEAIMDKLNFHFEKSIFVNKENQLFWNPIESWKNKWKEDLKTEKFIGSSTIFVFTTDAWHLFKALRTFFLWTAVAFMIFTASEFSIYGIIALIGTVALLKSAIFELFYSKLNLFG